MNMTATDGSAIQAHGGDIIKANDGSYYWFGEDKTGETTSGHFIGVNCYKSSNFATWESRGAVLKPQEGTNISSDSIVERPKVIYNDANDEYVMWFHSDTSNYGAAAVGIATSKTIDGNYTWIGSFKPFGNDSRDMTIYKDDDETAYLIFATANNANLQIASLTSDYYNVSEAQYTWSDVYWEAPGIFKIDGTYYLLYSRQDGWTPTDNYYMTASSMAGPWTDSVLLAPEGTYAYNTQNAYDITINGTESVFYMYYGDHWNAPNLGASSYSFYPAIYNGSGLSLHYTGGWTLDTETGVWSDLPFDTITAANDSSTIAPSSALFECSGCLGGKTVNMTAGSTFSFTWNGSAGEKVLSLQYVYDGGKQAWKQIGVTVDSVAVNGVALLESTRGTTVYLEAPIPVTLAEGSEVQLKLLDYTDTAVLIEGVKIYEA